MCYMLNSAQVATFWLMPLKKYLYPDLSQCKEILQFIYQYYYTLRYSQNLHAGTLKDYLTDI